MPTADSPADWIIQLLAVTGSGAGRWAGQRQCPAHADSSPSLTIGTGRNGQALLHCHAGCTTSEVLDSLKLTWSDLRETPMLLPDEHAEAYSLTRRSYPPLQHRGSGSAESRGFRYEATHQYTPDHRIVRYRHPNTREKEITWETRAEGGAWLPGLRPTAAHPIADMASMPLYNERQVKMGAAAGESVYVVESESSADAFTRQGMYATTWAGGAQAVNTTRLAQVLDGADVVIVPDNDKAGLECGRRVWTALAPVARLSHVLPEPGQDARDLLEDQGAGVFATRPPTDAADLIDERDLLDEDDDAAADDHDEAAPARPRHADDVRSVVGTLACGLAAHGANVTVHAGLDDLDDGADDGYSDGLDGDDGADDDDGDAL